MSGESTSTRRSFLKKGAVLAAPLAAVAGPAAVLADERLQARLARLEDEAAIRALHQSWVRRINSGGAGEAAPPFEGPENARDRSVRGIAADHAGQPDAIEVAADGRRATGRFACAVEIETAIAQDCTLARMAHAQGGGFIRHTERGVLEVRYAKGPGGWVMAKAEFARV